MTVTVYRSDDVGAPTVTSEEGSWITLLDAILINGYGSKAAAGWTKEFSGTNQAVYRNSIANGGTGTFFQVDHSKALSGSNYTRAAKVTGGSNCTGFDAITEPFGGGSGAYIHTSNTAITANEAYVSSWVAVADEHTLLVCMTSEANSNGVAIPLTERFSPQCFGDFHGWDAGQLGTAMIAAGSINSVDTTVLSGGTDANLLKDIEGNYPATRRGSCFIGGSSEQSLATSLRIDYDYRGKKVPRAMGFFRSQNAYEGIFRGLSMMWTNNTNALRNLDTFTLDGKSFLLIKITYGTEPGFLALETSDTWLEV